MRKFQWVKIPPTIVSKNKDCVWVSVWNFPPLQADFQLEEELFKQKQVEKKTKAENKKAKTEVKMWKKITKYCFAERILYFILYLIELYSTIYPFFRSHS